MRVTPIGHVIKSPSATLAALAFGMLGYVPSAKTRLDLAVYREISSVSDLIASYVLTEGVSFGAAWAPTVKIHLQAKLLYEDREYEGDPGFVLRVNQQRDDQVYGARLTAGINPYGFWTCGSPTSMGADHQTPASRIRLRFGYGQRRNSLLGILNRAAEDPRIESEGSRRDDFQIEGDPHPFDHLARVHRVDQRRFQIGSLER